MAPFWFFGGEKTIFSKKNCVMTRGARVMTRAIVPRIYGTVASATRHP